MPFKAKNKHRSPINRRLTLDARHDERVNHFMKQKQDLPKKKQQLKEMEDKGVMSWSIWEKEVSRFDAFYDETEQCFLLEGKVVVETKDGSVTFGKGDFVTLPKGLECVWDIKEPVRKHYNYI